jgi:hypothetical protein
MSNQKKVKPMNFSKTQKMTINRLNTNVSKTMPIQKVGEPPFKKQKIEKPADCYDDEMEENEMIINSLTTPLRPSYFDGKTYNEYLDNGKIEQLLQSDVLRSNRENDGDSNGCWDFLKMMKLTDEANQLTQVTKQRREYDIHCISPWVRQTVS